MSSRLLGYLLLLMVIAALALPMIAPTQQSNKPAPVVKWEYKVITIDGPACSADNAVQDPLNSLGQLGWELVSYNQELPAIPADAEGSMVIRPAATGPNRDTSPPVADSFEGTISMRTRPFAPAKCRIVLKREWHPQVGQ